MNPQNRPAKSPPVTVPPPNLQITNELAQSLLANQEAELKNEAARLQLQTRQLDYNAEYAKDSLRYQATDLASRPKETRKTILHIALIIGGFVAILLAFVIYLLENGHKDLVTSILKGVGWLASVIASYYLGQSKGSKSTPTSSSDASEAEVVSE